MRVFPDLETLSRGAAELVEEVALEAVSRRGRFTLALAGGRTPERLYRILAEDFGDRIAWERTHLFWGDERSVPPDHPESNFRMVAGSLFRHIVLPPGHVHRIRAERGPRAAAGSYERSLRRFFGQAGEGEEGCTFDLVLLGVGVDGHTASLFPGDHGLGGSRRWVRAVEAPFGIVPGQRITLTLPVINRSRNALFLVSGSDKGSVMRAILEAPDPASSPYPAARVEAREHTWWLVDEEALPGAEGL